MKINKEWLESKKACKEGIKWFCAKYGESSVDAAELLRLLQSRGNFEWGNWLATNAMSDTQNRQYAIKAAEYVLPIYETKFPNDDRPKKAIMAAKTSSGGTAAAYAAYAAVAAANISHGGTAAAYAAYAAGDAISALNAYATAAAAKTAANAAAYAAGDAADAAYAANTEIWDILFQYVISIFNKGV